jgi:hypothetical protein
MYKEMLVIPVNRVVGKKRTIRKNGGPRRRHGALVAYVGRYLSTQFLFAQARKKATTHIRS